MALDLTAAGLSSSLQMSCIPHLLLKGPTTARWLYADGTQRPYSDIDLLVRREHGRGAGEALTTLGFVDALDGFRPDEAEWHSQTWTRPGPHPAVIDLHISLALCPDPDATWRALWAHRERTTLAGQDLFQLDEPARCLVIALHAAQSGYQAAKPLEDLRRARRIAFPEVWDQARQIAEEVHAVSAFDVGVLMADTTPDELRRTPLWQTLTPELRQGVLRDGKGGRLLTRLTQLPLRDRPKALASAAFPSHAKLSTIYGRNRSTPYPRLWIQHARAGLQALPTAVAQARAAVRQD